MLITSEILVGVLAIISLIGGVLKFMIVRQDRIIKDLKNSIENAHRRLTSMESTVIRREDFNALRADIKEWKIDIIRQMERFCQMRAQNNN
jgi:hypothetical protein